MYNGSCVVEVVKEAVHAAMSEKEVDSSGQQWSGRRRLGAIRPDRSRGSALEYVNDKDSWAENHHNGWVLASI